MKVKLFFSKFLSFSLTLFVTISHRPSHTRLRVFILYFHEFNIFHPSSCSTHIHINIVRVRAMEDPVLGDGWPRVSLIPVNPINRARPYFTVFLCSTNLSHHILFASKYQNCHHFHSLSLTHTHTPIPSPRKSLWNFLICPISLELHDYPISDFEIHHFGCLNFVYVVVYILTHIAI